MGRRRDRRHHRPTFPLFFSPPLVFSALASKKVFPSPFSFFPFVFISGIQSAQRKDITKEGKRAQRRSGRRSTRERALEILQVRGLLPRPPPPLSSPAPPPRFPAPPPAPPIPAGTAPRKSIVPRTNHANAITTTSAMHHAGSRNTPSGAVRSAPGGTDDSLALSAGISRVSLHPTVTAGARLSCASVDIFCMV